VLADAAVAQELARPRALVLTDWEATVWDGAAAFASGGLFDLFDVPGWDTWLALVELPDASPAGRGTSPYLLSWVPLWARELVERAIAVHPVAALSWGTVTAAGIAARGWGRPWASDHP
jgi:hypothetical protein